MNDPALPKSCACLTPLFSGALVAISNWRCGGDDSPGREAEWCDADRIVITRRGSFELTVQGAPHFVDPLVATFWNRGDYYRVRHPVSGSDECTVFRLTERGSQELRDYAGVRRDSTKSFAATARTNNGRTYLRHRAALNAARQNASVDACDALAVEESAFEFLRAMADHSIGNPSSSCTFSQSDSRTQTRTVARAREIVSHEFIRPLSVTAIAREANCSPFHLSRLFRAATGLTLHRAVMQLRLREGLERLLDAPDHISAVALDVGFASHSHFADAFRAEYGCAPSEARLLLRNGKQRTAKMQNYRTTGNNRKNHGNDR